MKNNTSLIYGGVLVILLIAAFVFSNRGSALGEIPLNNQSFASLNTSATVTSTAKLVLADADYVSFRCYTAISGMVTLGFGTTTGLSNNSGYTIPTSTERCFSGNDLWRGNVYAVAPATTILSMSQL